jgi:type II secretory pathway component PulK
MIGTAVLWIVALAIFMATTMVIALAWRARRRHREAPEEQYRRAVRDIRGEAPTRSENPWPGMFGSAG